MKRFLRAVLSILLVAALCTPAAAETAEKALTKRAHILSCRSDAVVFLLDDPAGLPALWEVPAGAQTAFVGQTGAALQSGDILPGQAADVTFRYTYETGDDAPQPVACDKVQLAEEVVPVVSTVTADSLEPGWGVGTLISSTRDARNNRYTITLYIEAADTGAGALHTIAAGPNPTVYAPNGLRMWPGELPPFQRVYVNGSIGSGGGDQLRLLCLLDRGEMVLSPQ